VETPAPAPAYLAHAFPVSVKGVAIQDGKVLLLDFRPIMLRALQAGPLGCGLLLISSRAFPRSRKNSGSLIRALYAWLTAGPPAPPVTESWLLGASDSSWNIISDGSFPISPSVLSASSRERQLAGRGGGHLAPRAIRGDSQPGPLAFRSVTERFYPSGAVRSSPAVRQPLL